MVVKSQGRKPRDIVTSTEGRAGSVVARTMTAHAVRLYPIGDASAANGASSNYWPHGHYLRSFDPTAARGRGKIITTADARQAMLFRSVKDIESIRQLASGRLPRADGRPNRLLTAYDLFIESVVIGHTLANGILIPDPTRTNCTRVQSRIHGSLGAVTFQDHEIRKLKPYIEWQRAEGYAVTTERGIWFD